MRVVVDSSLASNGLWGSIPVAWTGLTALRYLYVPRCARALANTCHRTCTRSRPLACSPGVCVCVYVCRDLSGNQLTGSLQPLAHLGITTMFLYGNRFSGTLLPLATMPALVDVSVRNNFLMGEIPPVWASALTIRTLILQNNSLTGPVPATFADFSSLQTLYAPYFVEAWAHVLA